MLKHKHSSSVQLIVQYPLDQESLESIAENHLNGQGLILLALAYRGMIDLSFSL